MKVILSEEAGNFPQQIKCQICDKKFEPNAFELHLVSCQTHNCCFCLKVLASKKDLENHIDTAHMQELPKKTDKCPECGKEFFSEKNLRLHFKNVHEGEKVNKCEKCEKTFATPQSLRLHVSSIHDGIKFTCALCSRTFSTEQSLKMHVNSVHEGKRATCAICNTTFSQSSNLKKHMSRVHKNYYQCDLCEAAFCQKVNLTKHLINVHNLIPKDELEVSIEDIKNPKIKLEHSKIKVTEIEDKTKKKIEEEPIVKKEKALAELEKIKQRAKAKNAERKKDKKLNSEVTNSKVPTENTEIEKVKKDPKKRAFKRKKVFHNHQMVIMKVGKKPKHSILSETPKSADSVDEIDNIKKERAKIALEKAKQLIKARKAAQKLKISNDKKLSQIEVEETPQVQFIGENTKIKIENSTVEELSKSTKFPENQEQNEDLIISKIKVECPETPLKTKKIEDVQIKSRNSNSNLTDCRKLNGCFVKLERLESQSASVHISNVHEVAKQIAKAVFDKEKKLMNSKKAMQGM